MQAGNQHFSDSCDMPEQISVFPLSGALLLPGTQLPLNIFEPRYIAMVDNALADDRLIGIIQPHIGTEDEKSETPALASIGCCGRLTSLHETGDGRYQITLSGICRFKVIEEIFTNNPYRICAIEFFDEDFADDPSADDVDRAALLETVEKFLSQNHMRADWQALENIETSVLVNSLSVLAPYGAAEKQALLEAQNIKHRAETLIAMTQIDLAQNKEDTSNTLQ